MIIETPAWLLADFDVMLVPTRPARFNQKCGQCGKELYDTLCTTVRGAWEHAECMRAAVLAIRAAVAVKQCRGTTDGFIKAAQLGRLPGVSYDRSRPDTRRYEWQEIAE